MAKETDKRRGRAPRSTGKAPRIVHIAERLGGRIPASEWQLIPKDLSDQLDHYIYGIPKRDTEKASDA
jgi:hypothetical protein